jgi:hypothetical protein
MSYSIQINPDYTRVIYTGTLNNKDIQGVLKDSLTQDGNKLKLINRIEDMRELHGIKIGFDELMDFTENLRTIQLPHGVKTAILTGNSLQYGIARMFQTILEHPQMEIKVFSHEEEACKWVSAIE